MKIIVIRHTSVDVPKGICYGKSDVPTKDTFIIEAMKVKAGLQDYASTQIFSSPLKRCYQLANEISCNTTKIVTDPRLQELNFGDWEMMPWDKIFADPHGKQWMDAYETTVCPNGESYKQMVDRIMDFIKYIKREINNSQVILVTHAGVIRALHDLILDQSTDQTFSMHIDYGQIFEFEI